MNRSLYRTRIKFCGMTRAGDIRLAGELGVDAVGFIFAHGSPRRVAPAEARAMRQATAPMVDVVALFRNNSKEEVREVVRTVRPTLLQFHGEEDDAFCRSFNLPYLKAVPMGSGGVNGEDANARTLQLSYPNTAGFLFDSHAPALAAAPARPSTGRACPPACIVRSCWPVASTPTTCSTPSWPRCPGAWMFPVAWSWRLASRTATRCASSLRKYGGRIVTRCREGGIRDSGLGSRNSRRVTRLGRLDS